MFYSTNVVIMVLTPNYCCVISHLNPWHKKFPYALAKCDFINKFNISVEYMPLDFLLSWNSIISRESFILKILSIHHTS
jgi:hypothetical protein